MGTKHYVSACIIAPRTKEEIDNEIESQRRNYRKLRMVTVGQLVRALKKFDSDLPVCLADWNEQYSSDNNQAAGKVRKINGRFFAKEDDCYGEYIVIGD